MTKAKIYYFSLTDEMLKNDKLLWFHNTKFKNIPFETITPSKQNNWINLADTDFEELLPLYQKQGNKLFEKISLGVSTNRDEWVYDINYNSITEKSKFLSITYNESVLRNDILETIKWSSTLKLHYLRKSKSIFKKKNIKEVEYRPFHKNFFYSEKIFSDRLTQNHLDLYGSDLDESNILIGIIDHQQLHYHGAFAVNKLPDAGFSGRATQMLALYRYDSNGNRLDNITDWGLSQFTTHYKDDRITKEAIFYYTYAVLHNPAYRKKYELNLKREFPRLPFYDDFWQWSNMGKQLMDLHLEYETVEPFALKRVDKNKPKKVESALFLAAEPEPTYHKKPKVKLKADKENGIIYIDENTHLEGIPESAWTYKLGNRSALEWILDQYKEKKPTDKTIAEKFNTYQFADYKETVIDLLQRVCTVSVRTMAIIEEMA